MPPKFPPMPPWEMLRLEDDAGLVWRPAEPDDADELFMLMNNPGLPFLLDMNRPASVDQLRLDLENIKALATSGAPANAVRWVLEVDGRIVGMLTAQFRYLDKGGGTKGMLMRSANWTVYLHPDVLRQGIVRRLRGSIEDGVEGQLVRHFGIEQLVGWVDDDNENARMMLTGYGFEGPVNHDHAGGLGFYRRPTRRDLGEG